MTTAALAAGRRHARTLVPEAIRLCEEGGVALAEVRLICVAVGPGSFTGLRVGVTFAKTLAFAVGAEAVAVPSHLAVPRVSRPTDPPGTTLRVAFEGVRQ